MSHQFKPGDLALIKQCRRDPSMIGKCVELMVAVLPGRTVEHGGVNWRNESAEICWVVAGEGLVAMIGGEILVGAWGGTLSFFRESLLMPLRGDFAPEREKARELVQ